MSLSIERDSLSLNLIKLMFVALTLDMGGDFGVRNGVLALCAVGLLWINGVVLPKGWLLAYGLLVTCPAMSLLLGVVNASDTSISLSQFQSTALAFLIFLLIYKLPYQETTKALVFAISIAACVAVFLAIGLILGVDSASVILTAMAEKGGGFFGERGVGDKGVIPNVYFKSTLFFVPTFVYTLFTRKYWIAILCFLALIAAVSKTGMLVSVIVAFAYLIWNKNIKCFLIGGILLSIVVFFIAQTPLFFLFEQITNNESDTVSTRVGHLESLTDLWGNNPLNLFFGFGLGSTFYSSGAGGIVSNIEIDHFNVIRKYGLLGALIFFAWVLNTAFVAMKNSRAEIKSMGWSLLFAFLVAGTNPVLISPLFFIFLFITMAANHQSTSRNRIE